MCTDGAAADELGECRFEHPQNVVLGQVIATNMELENLAVDKDPALVGGPMAAEARLARTLRLWLELQACVSGFIDSTAADKDVMARSHLHLQPLVASSGYLGIWLPACPCSVKPGFCSVPSCCRRRAMFLVVLECSSLCPEAPCMLSLGNSIAGHSTAAGEKGGPVPEEHDGKTRQFRLSLRHLA